jgi:hypothetical protein
MALGIEAVGEKLTAGAAEATAIAVQASPAADRTRILKSEFIEILLSREIPRPPLAL